MVPASVFNTLTASLPLFDVMISSRSFHFWLMHSSLSFRIFFLVFNSLWLALYLFSIFSMILIVHNIRGQFPAVRGPHPTVRGPHPAVRGPHPAVRGPHPAGSQVCFLYNYDSDTRNMTHGFRRNRRWRSFS